MLQCVGTSSVPCSSDGGRGWLLISVSFFMGVCLCGVFFHLHAKLPPASLLKRLGLGKAFLFTSETSVVLLTVCFSLKNNPEFRSCLHLFNIANRISTSLQRLVCFWLFSFTTAVIERYLDLFPSIQLTGMVSHLDGDWGELLFWPTRLLCLF